MRWRTFFPLSLMEEFLRISKQESERVQLLDVGYKGGKDGVWILDS